MPTDTPEDVDDTTDGRSSRWDDHRRERRVLLVEASVRAINTHGPDVAVAEIAAEAGVSKPVLYRYFADKDQLHAAVGTWAADDVLARVVPAMAGSAPVQQRIAAAMDAYLAMIEENQAVFQLLVHHRYGGDPLAEGRARIVAAVARMLGDALRRLGLDSAPAEPWAEALIGLGLSTGEWWLDRRTMSRRAVGGYLTSFVWHAMEGAAGELGAPLSALDEALSESQPNVRPLRPDRRRPS